MIITDSQLTLPGDPEHASFTTPELGALVEALLLVAPDAPTIADLARAASVPPEQVEVALRWLDAQVGRGWVIQRHGDTVTLSTAPRFASRVRAFLGLEREAKLSAAALETVAIIAVQQPVTRAEIEAIRGVDSSGVLTTLHGRGLIEGTSRRATVGNPIEYGTTPLFLRHFGLRSLADLPPIGMVDGKDGQQLLEAAARPATVAPAVEDRREPA